VVKVGRTAAREFGSDVNWRDRNATLLASNSDAEEEKEQGEKNWRGSDGRRFLISLWKWRAKPDMVGTPRITQPLSEFSFFLPR